MLFLSLFLAKLSALSCGLNIVNSILVYCASTLNSDQSSKLASGTSYSCIIDFSSLSMNPVE